MSEEHRETGLGVGQTEEARRWRLFRVVVLSTGGGSLVALVFFVTLGLLNPQFPGLPLGGIVGTYIASMLFCLWLERRGQGNWAFYTYMVSLSLVVFGIAYLTGGVLGPTVVSIITIPVVAGLLGGARAAWWMAAIVVFLYVIMFALEQLGVLAPRQVSAAISKWVYVGTFVTGMVSTSLIISVFANLVQRALTATQQRGEALAAASEQARQAAEAERESRLREESAARQLRLAVQQYVTFLEQVSAGNYRAQVSLEGIDPEAAGSRELYALSEYLNATVETLVRALTDLHAVQRRYASESWADVAQSSAGALALRYRDAEVEPGEHSWLSMMEQAIRQRDVVTEVGELALPILLSDEVIGVVGARREGDALDSQMGWSDDELSIVRAAADQLSQTIETLRLLDETQRAAVRERAIGEMTSRVRESLDMDAILQTAVRELGRALGEAKVEVRLGTGPDVQD